MFLLVGLIYANIKIQLEAYVPFDNDMRKISFSM